MQVTGGGIDKPSDLGVEVVGGEGCRRVVSGNNQFICKVIADETASGVCVAVLDSVGVGAGLIHSVVVDQGAGGGFEADAGTGVAGGAEV